MLEIYTKEGWLPITNRQNYYTSYEYDGTQTLCFDISPSDEMYRYIANETSVRNEENRYLIKDINKRKTACTITCSLDMDDWHQNEPYLNTKDIAKFQTKSLSEILEAIKPSGWSILNAGIRDYRRTLEMEDASDYEVLFKCQEIFSVTYEIRTLDKQIVVKDPEQVVDKGVYITPQLNLESVTMKGNSKDFATRITAYGKQNEDGSYVNFASINGGKTYVEDNKYAGKAHPIWIVWKDERYTIPENLLADANKKLKEQAYPILSFEVTVNDLAETDDRYSFLKMGLYDIAHVIIDEHTEIIEKVIKLQRYHDSLEKNKITLSSEPQTITGKVNDAISILGNDGEKLKGSVLQQAQEMAQAARRAGVKTMVAFNNIKTPAALLAKQIIARGDIGEPVRFRGTFDQGFYNDPNLPWSWRCSKTLGGSGALGDLGAHTLSVAQFLLGGIREVTASAQTCLRQRPVPQRDAGYASRVAADAEWREVENDDQVQCLVSFDSGAAGVIEASRIAAGRIFGVFWEVSGTEGTLYMDGERFNELQVYRFNDDKHDRGFKTLYAGSQIPAYAGFFGFDFGGGGLGYFDVKVIEVHDLVQGICGDDDCYPNFEFGLQNQRVLSAIEASMVSRRWVNVVKD